MHGWIGVPAPLSCRPRLPDSQHLGHAPPPRTAAHTSPQKAIKDCRSGHPHLTVGHSGKALKEVVGELQHRLDPVHGMLRSSRGIQEEGLETGPSGARHIHRVEIPEPPLRRRAGGSDPGPQIPACCPHPAEQLGSGGAPPVGDLMRETWNAGCCRRKGALHSVISLHHEGPGGEEGGHQLHLALHLHPGADLLLRGMPEEDPPGQGRLHPDP